MAVRFSPQFLDEIRARVPVSQVVSRSVQLKKAGREWRGLSPFKSEKTPSFFVNDQKAFYHCFASGEHGDIFTFLMKVEGLSFPEAVEQLAGEAGLAMPAPEVRDPDVEDRRQRQFALLEAAASYFEDALYSGQGAIARDYVERRGLSRRTLSAFRIGFAPNSRTALSDFLKGKGFKLEEMAATGMVISGDDIKTPYDRFRNRVMFPIRDLKGRVIAFGGRALDQDQPAKYLNSPETALFHKSNVLFHLHAARQAAHVQGRIIAVEGYMDVAALYEAGIEACVAPLGTALTEQQLALLWRLADEPVLCFDGDDAGRKAAWRALDTALPHLAPGKSLMFAFLPDGLDPDDLVRSQGPAAMEAILAAARPMVDVVFERAWQEGDTRTPERRARLERRLQDDIAHIADRTLRFHYERDMRERLWQRLRTTGQGGAGRVGSRGGASPPRSVDRRERPDRGTQGGQFRGGQSGYRRQNGPAPRPGGASDSLLKSLAADPHDNLPRRELVLIAVLLHHPWLMDEEAETIAALDLSSPALNRLKDGLLALQASEKALDSSEIRSQLTAIGLGPIVDQVEASMTFGCEKLTSPQAGHAEVRVGWRHTLELHERQVGLRQALDEAERAWHRDESDDAFARIRELQEQLERLASQALRVSDEDTPSRAGLLERNLHDEGDGSQSNASGDAGGLVDGPRHSSSRV